MLRSSAPPAAVGLLLLAALVVSDACPQPAPRPPSAVKNVILFIGDGMGIATITAARVSRGSRDGLSNPSEGRLRLDSALHVSLVRTASADKLVTDSAAAITAIMAGRKVPNGVLNCVPSAGGGIDTLVTIAELAKSLGMSVGVVTNTRITHATPAGAYAHDPDRDHENDIAATLVPGRGNPRLGDGLDVLMGGGRNYFLPAGDGARKDDRNLMREMETAGYAVVTTRDGLEAAGGASDRILGLFARGHLTYGLDRTKESTEPTLPEMTGAAIRVLSRNPRGYFLLVEGGRIDHALHDANAHRAIAEMLELDDTVARTLDAISDDTLVLVTADHDHVMVIAGYPDIRDGIYSQAGVDRNSVPYTTLLFANGPPDSTPPNPLTPEELDRDDFRERTGVPLNDETHGGMDVPLYAWGPESSLKAIPATLDNTDIFRVMCAALGIPLSASPPAPARR